MAKIITSITLPDGFNLAVRHPEYIVLIREQHTKRLFLGTAKFNGTGWQDASEAGQPEVIQYLSHISGRFEDTNPRPLKEKVRRNRQ